MAAHSVLVADIGGAHMATVTTDGAANIQTTI